MSFSLFIYPDPLAHSVCELPALVPVASPERGE
jgi:hypothetical protein